MDAEDLVARPLGRQREQELAVEAPRAAQRGVDRVDAVGGADDDDLGGEGKILLILKLSIIVILRL